jgi:potassium/hydrogen antiporter
MRVDLVLILSGTIILLGFVSRAVFERTRIPDVLILLGLGVLLGHSLGAEARLFIYRFAPHFGTLALIMILFEGGLHIDPGHAWRHAPPAMVLSALSLGVTALLITSVALLAWEWELIPALLLGLVLGCTSSAIVLPVAHRTPMPEGTRTLIDLDAAFSDTFAIVALFTVLGLSEAHEGWMAHGFLHLGRSLAVAAGTALALSLIWLIVLAYTKDRPLSYLITFAVILLLYGAVEHWQGSGPIAVLLFGILVTESKYLPKWLFVFGKPSSSRTHQEAHETLQWFHQELTFLVRTFFFVYLGLLFEVTRLTLGVIVASLALCGLIVAGRAASVYLLRRSLPEHSLWLVGAFLPRGLVTAVLAAWPARHEIPGTERFLDYTVPVIIMTNVLMACCLLARSRDPVMPAASS